MDSWWQLGEGAGLPGNEMEVWRLTCAFCGGKGNFSRAHHEEKKKPNSRKKLNFDMYVCQNCMSPVHVLWSAAEFSAGPRGIYDFQVLPWPLGKAKPSEN
jgi:hypothetical protein